MIFLALEAAFPRTARKLLRRAEVIAARRMLEAAHSLEWYRWDCRCFSRYQGEVMIRIKGKCENKTLQLSEPVDLPDGTEVLIEIRPITSVDDDCWRDLGMERLESE
jgi:hypothetical protein